MELQGNDPALMDFCPEMSPAHWKRKNGIMAQKSAKDDWGKDSDQWGEVLTLKRREISQ